MFVSARPLPISSPFPLVHTSLLYFSPGESEHQHRVLRWPLHKPGVSSRHCITAVGHTAQWCLRCWLVNLDPDDSALLGGSSLKASGPSRWVVQLFIHIVRFLATLATSSYTLAACIYCLFANVSMLYWVGIYDNHYTCYYTITMLALSLLQLLAASWF